MLKFWFQDKSWIILYKIMYIQIAIWITISVNLILDVR
jgi:hypothetical protein